MALLDSFPGASGTVDSTELRKNLAGLIVRDTAGNPRAGIFPRHTNALVTSRADMKLDVAAFEGASVRGGGPLFMANDGVAQSPALPIPLANSQISILYFKNNESGAPYADTDNLPIFGIASGAAAASPTPPSIAGIAGATALATITVPSTATATNSGGVVITNTFDYTTTSGGMLLFRTDAARDLYVTATPGQQAYSIAEKMTAAWNGTKWVRSTSVVELGFIDRGATPTDVIVSAASTWQDVPGVVLTATSAGGVVEVSWEAVAKNQSGGTNYYEILYRIVYDGVSTGGERNFALPGVLGINPPYEAHGRFQHTPAAGAHTWKLQHFCGAITSVGTKWATLKLTER